MFSPNGHQLASGFEYGTIQLYDATTEECLQTLKGHRDLIRSIAFSPNGQQLVSSSRDRTTRLWDVATGNCLQTLEGAYRAASFSLDGSNLVTDFGTLSLE